MEIEKHWLKENTVEKITKNPTTNYQYQILPNYLIIHYTAGDKAEGAIDWFKQTPEKGNPDRICAHIVIDLDGTITQLVPFNTRCNHAGYSCWDSRTGINEYSIGIEIVNSGFCEKLTNGSYKRKVGEEKNGTPIYKVYPKSISSEIIETSHKHKFWTENSNRHWFKFTSMQINAVSRLSKLLIENYQLSFVVGHDDISPGRKPDPGPAFPWDEFKINIFGKTDNIGKVFLVNSDSDGFAEFRTKADKNSSSIKKLKNGHEVGLIETFGQWFKVFLVNDIKEIKEGKQSIKIEGWIHSSLLKLKNN
jgi:N-acetylmuramoyl-L-alanine amidase